MAFRMMNKVSNQTIENVVKNIEKNDDVNLDPLELKSHNGNYRYTTTNDLTKFKPTASLPKNPEDYLYGSQKLSETKFLAYEPEELIFDKKTNKWKIDKIVTKEDVDEFKFEFNY